MTMFRHLSMIVATALALASFGCDKKPQQPRQPTPAETGAEETQPDADTGEPDAAQPQADQPQADQPDADPPDADPSDADQAAACPEARDYQGMCAQVITWASDPETGQCCQYGSPCEAPENWQTFTNEADCAQAGGQTRKGEEG